MEELANKIGEISGTKPGAPKEPAAVVESFAKGIGDSMSKMAESTAEIAKQELIGNSLLKAIAMGAKLTGSDEAVKEIEAAERKRQVLRANAKVQESLGLPEATVAAANKGGIDLSSKPIEDLLYVPGGSEGGATAMPRTEYKSIGEFLSSNQANQMSAEQRANFIRSNWEGIDEAKSKMLVAAHDTAAVPGYHEPISLNPAAMPAPGGLPAPGAANFSTFQPYQPGLQFGKEVAIQGGTINQKTGKIDAQIVMPISGNLDLVMDDNALEVQVGKQLIQQAGATRTSPPSQ